MTGRPDRWRSWLIVVLVVELVGGIAFGGLLWSLWNIDFGDDAGRDPSWSAGPWWMIAGTAACASLWTTAIVLNVRNAPAARIALASIAALHLVAAAVVPLIDVSDPARVLAVVGLLTCSALIATLAVFPSAEESRPPASPADGHL